MSRLEANISLLIITFLGSVQYVFLAGVPASVSHFAFLCITNLVGFVISLAFFFGELFRLDSRQVVQSVILSVELVVFNIFMLIGASGIGTTTTASVLSAYFVFVVIFSWLFMKHKPDAWTIAGVFVVLAGLFLMTDTNIKGLMNVNILYLVAADAALAMYVLTIGAYASSSNPSILAMGQMLFCFVFSLVFWVIEALFFGAEFTLPADKSFWGSVIYIAFFMRGLYSIVQIYAQRYVTPLNTSLIFSTEVIMTMALSPLMSYFFGMPEENISALRVYGSVLIVLGLLITEPSVISSIKKVFCAVTGTKISIIPRVIRGVRRIFSVGLDTKVIIISAAAYFLTDFPVQITDLMPVHAGIKNFLPFCVGLFFGLSGAAGCCIGCAASFLVIGLPVSEILSECVCITVTGLGIWLGWHFFSHSHKICFRTPQHYARYMLLVSLLSTVCLNVTVYCSYLACAVLIALPLNILMGNLLGIDPILPVGITIKNDATFVIDSDPESISSANDLLEEAGVKAGSGMKQIFELQSCIEELSIRILNNQPETKINVQVRFDYAVSVKISFAGKRYNPFVISKGDDELDIVSLKIIKHRALRASYSHRKGENVVHVVV